MKVRDKKTSQSMVEYLVVIAAIMAGMIAAYGLFQSTAEDGLEKIAEGAKQIAQQDL